MVETIGTRDLAWEVPRKPSLSPRKKDLSAIPQLKSRRNTTTQRLT